MDSQKGDEGDVPIERMFKVAQHPDVELGDGCSW